MPVWWSVIFLDNPGLENEKQKEKKIKTLTTIYFGLYDLTPQYTPVLPNRSRDDLFLHILETMNHFHYSAPVTIVPFGLSSL